jgi:hypothetical protein
MKTNELIVKTMSAFDLDDHDDLINLDGDNSNNGGTGNPENVGEPDGGNETAQQNIDGDNSKFEQNPSTDNVDHPVLEDKMLWNTVTITTTVETIH